jgi:dolichol-phosphate mannosyltransferase
MQFFNPIVYTILVPHVRIAAVIPVFNEEKKILEVLKRIPRDIISSVIVVDDCSTDLTPQVASKTGAQVISHPSRLGVGRALRTGYKAAAIQGADWILTIAGNNKDFPEDVSSFLPMLNSFDFIQGSRHAHQSQDFGPMPKYRIFATKHIHPKLAAFKMRQTITDSTNGFRLVRVPVLLDERLKFTNPVFDKYSYEVALLVMSARLNYRVTEVPVRKVYPEKNLGQTKMKPLSDWWSILWPLLLPISILRKLARS